MFLILLFVLTCFFNNGWSHESNAAEFYATELFALEAIFYATELFALEAIFLLNFIYASNSFLLACQFIVVFLRRLNCSLFFYIFQNYSRFVSSKVFVIWSGSFMENFSIAKLSVQAPLCNFISYFLRHFRRRQILGWSPEIYG